LPLIANWPRLAGESVQGTVYFTEAYLRARQHRITLPVYAFGADRQAVGAVRVVGSTVALASVETPLISSMFAFGPAS
jgi:hypothetical protein